MAKRAALLWTGGKDSNLALDKAKLEGWHIDRLVTFAPPQRMFMAHPIPFMELQATALHIKWELIEVREPYRESYEAGLHQLKNQGIDTVITGDISEVDGHPNWIRECNNAVNMKVETPLWGCNRKALLQRLIARKFTTIFSCVKQPWLTDDWIGKELTDSTILELEKLNQINGMDLCGENGEYHTLVLDGTYFQQKIEVSSFSKWTQEKTIWMHKPQFKLVNK